MMLDLKGTLLFLSVPVGIFGAGFILGAWIF